MKILTPAPDWGDAASLVAWQDSRAGKATASQFHRILTPKTLKYSGQAPVYASEILAERLLGQPLEDSLKSGLAHRGTFMEKEALSAYAFLREVSPERVGFCVMDNEEVGASPDALVGDDGGVEIKCFGMAHHVRCLIGEDPAQATQVQGGIWVCEREWWDQFAYMPGHPPVLLRTYRDEKFIKALSEAMDRFLEELHRGQAILDAMGEEGRVDASGVEIALRASVGEAA